MYVCVTMSLSLSIYIYIYTHTCGWTTAPAGHRSFGGERQARTAETTRRCCPAGQMSSSDASHSEVRGAALYHPPEQPAEGPTHCCTRHRRCVRLFSMLGPRIWGVQPKGIRMRGEIPECKGKLLRSFASEDLGVQNIGVIIFI